MTYSKEDPQTIESMFDSIAYQYDRANRIMSFNQHIRWNRQLVEKTISQDGNSPYIDLCCGTGEIAFTYLKGSKTTRQVYLVDFSEKMLHVARDKAQKTGLDKHDLSFLKADVQKLPLLDKTIGYATMAYGIRNVQNPEVCLEEIYRILKPGGRLGILELTRPTHPLMRFGHKVYLQTVLPLVGKCFTSNQDAYEYLCRSIQHFIAPDEMMETMEHIGFESIAKIPLSNGIATIILGQKGSEE